MNTRFDLEQGIMECWNVVEDLKHLFDTLKENKNFTMDNATSIINSIVVIYEMKFERTYRIFNKFLKEYYTLEKELKEVKDELAKVKIDIKIVEEANRKLEKAFVPQSEVVSLDDLFNEEELRLIDEEQSLQGEGTENS